MIEICPNCGSKLLEKGASVYFEPDFFDGEEKEQVNATVYVCKKPSCGLLFYVREEEDE